MTHSLSKNSVVIERLFFREKFSFRTAAKEKSPLEEIRLPSNSNEHVQ